MNKIMSLIVFMLLHGLMILSPPTGGTHMVQAYDTADRQAALETTSSRNWNFPRILKVAYPLEKLKGIKIMLALDSDRWSGTVKIAYTKHFSAEVNVEPERIRRKKPSSPNRNPAMHASFKFPPPPMPLYCHSCR
ncbi:zinc finger X-linked protein [Salix suchowensis]|nr:zinc finger X-linked protein [Salix suchowensis]